METASRGVDPNQQEQWSMAWSRVVVRSWVEPDFRNEVLRADAGRLRELCREMGYEVPADIDVVVREVEDTRAACSSSAHRLELPLPPPPPAESLAIALEDYASAGVRSPPFCCC
jgi:hypothetical protein